MTNENRLSEPLEASTFPETEAEAIEQDGWTDAGADAANEAHYAEEQRAEEKNLELERRVADLTPEGYFWTGTLTTSGHAVLAPRGKQLDSSNAKYVGPVAKVELA
ncbi:MAG TPA: hypothetical protein VJR06_02325 [Nitrososphaerales archaeon]|nr:hypothetical protein [Nitrososphaerales archaeon]